jgi:3'-phosphoadenosine 5'-phosphosulfate sulfotransferase (PAPS reductase)/FAD synthetase
MLIVTGAKEADSLWRRQKYFKFMTDENMHFPLRKWRKDDVLAYLDMHKIELPKAPKSGSTGIDLSTVSLLWLYDHYKDDFEKIERWFPYVGAVVKRREWYGVK